MDHEDMHFDTMNDLAWVTFGIVLETAMVRLEETKFLCVEVAVPTASAEGLGGSVPYVQAIREAGAVHVEVASNQCLAPRFRMPKPARQRLRAQGFHKPTGEGLPNYWARFPLDQVQDAALLLVTALREVYGVEHPAFLTTEHAALAGYLRDGGGPARESLPEREPPMRPWVPAPGEDLAAYPEDVDDLQRQIADALLPMVGQVPEPDEDGDVGILAGRRSVVFVRPAGPLPQVVVHSTLVVGVADRKAARAAVANLNRSYPGIQFVLVGGLIDACVVLPATPFVPAHLRVTVDRLVNLLPTIDADLAHRVRGRVFVRAEGPGGRR